MYRLITRGAESESFAPCNARFFPVWPLGSATVEGNCLLHRSNRHMHNDPSKERSRSSDPLVGLRLERSLAVHAAIYTFKDKVMEAFVPNSNRIRFN